MQNVGSIKRTGELGPEPVWALPLRLTGVPTCAHPSSSTGLFFCLSFSRLTAPKAVLQDVPTYPVRRAANLLCRMWLISDVDGECSKVASDRMAGKLFVTQKTIKECRRKRRRRKKKKKTTQEGSERMVEEGIVQSSHDGTRRSDDDLAAALSHPLLNIGWTCSFGHC